MIDKNSKPNILVVDDIPANLIAMRDILAPINVNIIEADNGNDALSLVTKHDFALVLLDVQVPIMDGYEVAKLMHGAKHSKHIPIIFVTANSREEIHELKGYDIGAVDYIMKPVNRRILRSKVKVFIDLYQQREILKTLNAELEVSRDAAHEAARMKSDFLANMSHEIRTPMNGVLGMTNLVLETKLTAEQRNLIEIVRKSGENLLEIINDILDLSKIEAGKLELEPINFPLYTAVEEATDMLTIPAQEKGIELLVRFAPDTPKFIVGDSGRIKQILLNIVGNAIKFTKKGYVLINISAKEEKGKSRLYFEIEDTGIGIPKDRLDYIFNKFSQAEESTTRKFGGTGLGLTICKKLVEMMGGEVGVKSELGKGSVFSFDIFVPLGKIEPEEKTDIPKCDLSHVRVLAIDDVKINCEILEQYLKGWNISCDSVASAEEGLTVMQQAYKEKKPYEILLLDYNLPSGMNGKEFAAEIKADKNLKDTILIMITSAGEIASADEMVKMGFSGFLLKPFHPLQLKNVLSLVWDAKLTDNDNKKLVTRYMLTEITQNATKGTQIDTDKYKKTRVLVVEDITVNLMLITKILTKAGCHVDSASNGLEAVNMMSEFWYDIVFMDCQMPEMDGYEATREIRKMEEKNDKHTTIIALTAAAMQKDKERCLAAGMDDYLNKPLKREFIYGMLEKWINKEKANDA